MTDDTAPVTANLQTGLVTADTSETVAPPPRWVASLMWILLMLVLGLVVLASAGALIVDFIAPSNPAAPNRDTILLLHTGSLTAMIALFTTRPGTKG